MNKDNDLKAILNKYYNSQKVKDFIVIFCFCILLYSYSKMLI